MLELSGTTTVVGKTEQLKFYAAKDLTESFRAVIEDQGLSLSEGISRLMELLVNAPDEMKPVLLRQAPGDAAIALARHTIRNRPVASDRPKKNNPTRGSIVGGGKVDRLG